MSNTVLPDDHAARIARLDAIIERAQSLPSLPEMAAQLPVFSANNPPAPARETGRKSLPGAGLRADAGG